MNRDKAATLAGQLSGFVQLANKGDGVSKAEAERAIQILFAGTLVAAIPEPYRTGAVNPIFHRVQRFVDEVIADYPSERSEA